MTKGWCAVILLTKLVLLAGVLGTVIGILLVLEGVV